MALGVTVSRYPCLKHIALRRQHIVVGWGGIRNTSCWWSESGMSRNGSVGRSAQLTGCYCQVSHISDQYIMITGHIGGELATDVDRSFQSKGHELAETSAWWSMWLPNSRLMRMSGDRELFELWETPTSRCWYIFYNDGHWPWLRLKLLIKLSMKLKHCY